MSAVHPAQPDGAMLLGGTSEIGLAILRELRSRGALDVALVGRGGERLDEAARGLDGDGFGRVVCFELDARSTERHGEVLERAFDELGTVGVVILAVGVLGERGGAPSDTDGAVGVLEVNAVGAGSLLMHAARRLAERGGGTILVLSSVAGERPRRANLVYGASKAALDFLARGLGDDLEGKGVRVVVVRPGFVHTRMTRGLEPAPLASTPEKVAVAAVAALDGRARVVWVPPVLRWVMLMMRALPRPLFRRIRR